MITTQKILAMLLMLLCFTVTAYAQTDSKMVREYNLGDGYIAFDATEGERKFTFVKFPERMVGNENPCSFTLFAEVMHVAALRVFGPTSFVNGEPKINPGKSETGIAFYADTNDNHRIEIVIMVQTLESRFPIGVRMEKRPIKTQDF